MSGGGCSVRTEWIISRMTLCPFLGCLQWRKNGGGPRGMRKGQGVKMHLSDDYEKPTTLPIVVEGLGFFMALEVACIGEIGVVVLNWSVQIRLFLVLAQFFVLVTRLGGVVCSL